MVLKKSDKIIAVIGVIILIVAIFGILLYAGSEEPTEEGGKTKVITYEVEWIPDYETINLNGYAGRNGDYTKPFDIEVIKPGSIITKIDVNITWKDAKTYGIIFKGGYDTLKADITLVDGETKTHQATGQGNESLSFTLYDTPSDGTIEDVQDIFEAEQKIMDEYADKNTVSFETKITVTPGEKLGLRPIKILRYMSDKGEYFDLEITCYYVYPEITEFEENGSTGDIITGGYHNVYTSTNFALTKL